MSLKRVNLGCGETPLNGWVNIDKDRNVKCEIHRDLEKGLPFDDDSVDEIHARHIIEHVKDDVFLMNEIWRVCKNGASVRIIVPASDSQAAHDFDHKSYWNERKFSYLKKENRRGDYEGLVCDFEIEITRVEEKGIPNTCIDATLTVIK